MTTGDVLSRKAISGNDWPVLVVEATEDPCVRVAVLTPGRRIPIPEAYPVRLLEQVGWAKITEIPEQFRF